MTHSLLRQLLALAALALPLAAGEPSRRTLEAFQRHVQSTEAADNQQQGLWVDIDPARRQRVRDGVLVVAPHTGKGLIEIDGGLIHDWIGAMFVPSVTLDQVLALVQDYNRHKFIYPDVMDSRIVRRQGDDFQIYLRLKRKQVITVVLDTDHDVRYQRLSKTSARSRSYTTRVVEVEKAGTPAERVMPPSASHGYLWRLDTYWRFEERDGGVYVECEAITLTRNVPTGFGWLFEPIIRDLPGQSLERTLSATRKALGH